MDDLVRQFNYNLDSKVKKLTKDLDALTEKVKTEVHGLNTDLREFKHSTHIEFFNRDRKLEKEYLSTTGVNHLLKKNLDQVVDEFDTKLKSMKIKSG